MSDTARTALTVLCYAVAALAQLAALGVLVAEGRRTGAALRHWRDAEPGPIGPGTPGPGGSSAGIAPRTDRPHGGRAGLVDALLGSRFDRGVVVVLLTVGVVVGGIGHLLGL
ncbi:hypothetical protein [Geodermatophilus sabuli]|uniref:Uncharacterized protein n=1 Tax=Geodermatophilus sabuli TaxID=1564158 RepID=A0A285EGG3_9ACTN|nr:hypothetical protein [Geodermatophilus sabuli]MBB3083080.1 hypothetical protein [Geodermatophilus sabuli]SNX98077.1 hypothetical protein SAMN06893097_109157 [Geodermatophilus sabuli]